MKNYRPDEKDWVKQRNKFFDGHHPTLLQIYKTREMDYEAGADAMFEALMKYRVKMPSDFKPILIVIPEEVKE